jgi:predicted nucleic acid-binding protein
MMVLLDTNILLRASDATHDQYSVARAAIDRIVAAGKQPRLVPQVLYEFWVVATRPSDHNGLGIMPAEVHAKVLQLRYGFELLPDVPAIFDTWFELVSRHSVRGKPSHDARLVAAMQVHGITQILTFNGGDFARYPGIMVMTPDEVVTQ